MEEFKKFNCLNVSSKFAICGLQLMTMWEQRHNHRLPEWRKFCKELEEKLPLFKDLLIANGKLKEE